MEENLQSVIPPQILSDFQHRGLLILPKGDGGLLRHRLNDVERVGEEPGCHPRETSGGQLDHKIFHLLLFCHSIRVRFPHQELLVHVIGQKVYSVSRYVPPELGPKSSVKPFDAVSYINFSDN